MKRPGLGQVGPNPLSDGRPKLPRVTRVQHAQILLPNLDACREPARVGELTIGYRGLPGAAQCGGGDRLHLLHLRPLEIYLQLIERAATRIALRIANEIAPLSRRDIAAGQHNHDRQILETIDHDRLRQERFRAKQQCQSQQAALPNL